jgi:hypothetical protein
MTEEEEFEFRHRLEQEQIQAQATSQAQESPPKQGILGAVGAALGSRPELKPYGFQPGLSSDQPATPVQSALSAAGQTLAAPIRMGQTLSAGPQATGEAIAETGGELGYPKTGVALGAIPAMAPYVLSGYAAMKGLYASENPTLRGLLNTPQELSPQYSAQNKAIGVTRRVPQEGGKLPQFAQPEAQGLATKPPRPMVPAETLPEVVPTRLPSKPGDFLAYANQKLAQHGSKVNPQELMDWQVKLQTDMSNGVIPKIDKESGRITTIYQQATDLLSRIKGTFSPIAEQRLTGAELPPGTIPTRAGLDKAYGIASNVQSATRKAVKYGSGIAGVAALEEYIRRRLR